MEILLDNLSPHQVYFYMTQTLVPRPIAWVLTENANGRYNLAPFSYFTALCSNPPLLLLSIGKKPDGNPKDTRLNIEQRNDFVVHIAHAEMIDPLNESSATLPAEVSEVEELGLKTISFDGFRLPRLADCRVAYACERYDIQHVGAANQALIFGRVRSLFIDDAICEKDEKGRLKVNVDALDPIARLGADEYAGLGEITKLKRPK